nr:MAG TPA: tail tape measure protein [Caudoviricetes sp.]
MIAKAGIAAFGAVATAIGKVAKDAANNYAEYEQLVGGAELMFGDAYATVAENAKNSFKTVQMSQNDYLTQVNGFATGLKTALNGNEQAAAELADRIIQAEADVIAATGNTQEAVQNAFNGIMRSNYTMLDNLQLGITPTKEGFEELIDKVNQWNAANGKSTSYTLGNLADMQSALVDYIEMQGLAGYAAMEAADTIQGSIASLRGAWDNFLTALADPDADLGERMDQLVDSGLAVLDNIAPRLIQTLPRIAKGISGLIERLSPYVSQAIADLLPALIDGATELLKSFVNAVGDFLNLDPLTGALIEIVVGSLATLTVAIKATRIATETLIPVWKALSAAFTGSPLGLVIVGLTALVTVSALIIESLTSVSRRADELSESARGAADALGEIEGQANSTIAETFAAADAADKYLNRLDELGKKTRLTAAEQKEYAATVEKLQATLPDVTIEIDEQTGKLKESTDAIRDQVKAWQEAAVAEALLEKRKALYAKQAEVIIEKTKNENSLMDVQQQQAEILAEAASAITDVYDANGKAVADWGVEEWNTFQQMAGNAQELQSAYWLAQDEASKLQPEIDALHIAIEKGEDVISDYDREMQGLDDVENALIDTSDELADVNTEVSSRLNTAAGMAKDLRKAYDDAYKAAKEMVEGSSELFQDMSERSTASLEDMTKNEQSRAEFYTEYSEALSKALSVVPESLRGAVLSMADMSQGSLAQLQAIGSGSKDEVENLAAAYEATQKAQKQLSENLALAATDFEKNKKYFISEAEDLVKELDQYDAMYEAGANSARGYLNGMLHEINSELRLPGVPGALIEVDKGANAGTINLYQTFDSTATQSEIRMRAQSALEVALSR